jgi:ribosomal protein S18 acetylase RimI-like enzyme
MKNKFLYNFCYVFLIVCFSSFISFSQEILLQPLLDVEIPQAIEATYHSAAVQACQAGWFSNESEAVEEFKQQANEIVNSFENISVYDEWKGKNFIFSIIQPTHSIPCGHLWFSIKDETEAFIENLFIDFEYRSMGIGTQVLKNLESEIKKMGCETIRLHVFSHNQAAYQLYKKLGYEVESMILRDDEVSGFYMKKAL